ncbi:sulfotransferase [Isoptericola haloaureus]|uniref:Sulfotransferase n=1 Tax=Isoptericola haloaureus TaxID=1542902 RepID=A0ABU7Z520_9MICO
MDRQYFLCVGAQKAGTTWLHDQLGLHPGVGLPPRKELHYFDSAFPTRFDRSFGVDYVRELRRKIDQQKQLEDVPGLLDIIELAFQGPERYRAYLDSLGADVVGEITPAYAGLTRETYEVVRKTLQPKVIFIMRDPLERYWSAVRMSHRRTPYRRRRLDIADRFDRDIDTNKSFVRSDYATTVQLLDETFGDDVLYLFYETLFTADNLRRVARHIGAAEEWPWDLGHTSHVGRQLDMPDSAKVRDRLRPVYEFTRQRFGDEIPESWHY